MNLILAVIIQRAQEAREGDQALKAQETLFVRDSAKIRLMKLCAIMDEDGSGNLTREELVGAYALDEEFRVMLTSMDIREEELDTIFYILDSDGSGEVSYEEFCDELIKLQTR